MLHQKFANVDRILQLSQTLKVNARKEHIRHAVLYKFNTGDNAIAAAKGII